MFQQRAVLSVYLPLLALDIFLVTTAKSAKAQADFCRHLAFNRPIRNKRLTGHVIKTTQVPDLEQCQWLCYLEANCVSLNLGPESDNTKRTCELNNADKNSHPEDLITQEGYLYQGAKNPCSSGPCFETATCQTGFTEKGYRCLCPAGIEGDNCEIDIDECASSPCVHGTCYDRPNMYKCSCDPGFTGINCDSVKLIKMKPSSVCFGARDDSPGIFTVPTAGDVITFKLIYLNGSVNCHPSLTSKWGCYWPDLGNTTMGTHITDDQRQPLLPGSSLLIGGSGCTQGMYYSLPSVDPDFSELLFDDFSTPLSVSVGQQFQIWFGEDLVDCSEGDNSGQTCVEVYAFYV